MEKKYYKFIIIVLLCLFGMNFNIYAKDAYKKAEKLFDEKKYEDAIVQYKAALGKYKNKGHLTAYIQNQIAEGYFRQGKWEEAYNEFKIVEEKHKTSPFCSESQFKKARCKYEQKKYEEAAIEFEGYTKVYKAGKKTGMAYAYAAFCYSQSKHPIKALSAYKEFKKTNKDKSIKLDKKIIEEIKKLEKKK